MCMGTVAAVSLDIMFFFEEGMYYIHISNACSPAMMTAAETITNQVGDFAIRQSCPEDYKHIHSSYSSSICSLSSRNRCPKFLPHRQHTRSHLR